MDWTPWIGRRRPVEEDALRVLTVVRELGEPASEEGFSTCLLGELRLQQLDHLIRRPIELAFALIAAHAGPDADARVAPRRRAELVRDVRRMVAEGAGERPDGQRLRRFDGGGWERWDDVWAFLGCRQLLEVRARGGPGGGFAYWLTEAGARRLAGLYVSHPDLETYRRRCRSVRRHFLPKIAAGSAGSDDALGEVGRRLDHFRREHQLSAEDDLLERFFHSTFGEWL